MTTLLRSTGIILLSYAYVTSVFACEGGREFIKDVGMYTVDLTDDSVVIDPGQIVHFDFSLLNKSDPMFGPLEAITKGRADVSILHGETVLYTKTVAMNQMRELTGIDYTFPQKNGDYTLALHFYDGQKTYAQTSFPLQVGGGELLSLRNILLTLGIVVSAGVVILIGSKLFRS